MQTDLPIWQIRDSIVETLSSDNRLVLIAPTGSGKTTQVPQMLLDGGLAGAPPVKGERNKPHKIVVLQPRRVAARAVATRVAWERKSPLGQEVGYQIRFDDQTSLGTRICFVTEGILLRWLQDDPELREIACVLFDEFHERNLLSDVALGLCRRLQAGKRPDLKLVVMSATLEAKPVADYLSDPSSNLPCPILVSEGSMYPVEVEFLEMPDPRPIYEQAADRVVWLIASGESGDILIFMPGMQEIQSTIRAISSTRMAEKVALIPLHGDLAPEEQDAAFLPNPLRKIIVSTNVAETSVTIDGVRQVIDSGLARIARYDAERGLTTLMVEPISRASADQRKGRAGRTAPGVCHRLWTESSQLDRPERNTPEIQRADLAEVVLLLHSLGIQRATEFAWLDKPDPRAVEQAENLLRSLGALRVSDSLPARQDGGNPASDITELGRQMLRLPMHPRFSRMLLEASKRGCLKPAALCAALVSGRDLLKRLSREEKHIAEARELFEASATSDFFTLMRAFQFARNNHFDVEKCRRYGVQANIARQVDQTFQQLLELAEKRSLLKAGEGDERPSTAGDEGLLRSLMAGFIDQLCVRRDLGNLECEMTEGRQVGLMRESVVQNSRLFVASSLREITSRTGEPMILAGLATAVEKSWILEMFPESIQESVEHLYDRTHRRVAAVKLVRYRDLVIDHAHQSEVEPEAAGCALAEAFAKGWFELPLFNHEVRQFLSRVQLVAQLFPELELPELDARGRIEVLARALAGMTLVREAQGKPLLEFFHQAVTRDQREWIDNLAPTQIPWPGGKAVKLQYPLEPKDEDGDPASPEVQVKIQDCFGLKEHPHIAEGKLPVKIWLQTPDGKRLEGTYDWPAFKAHSYPRLKSGLLKKFPGQLWL